MVIRISNKVEKINCPFFLRTVSSIKAGPERIQAFSPSNSEELADSISYIKNVYHIDPIILGDCTNLLVSDDMATFHGFISMKKFSSTRQPEGCIEAGSGASLHQLAAGSLVFTDSFIPLAGIPGTVGGAVRGNAGANGASVSDFIIQVTAMDQEGKIRVFSPSECRFSYRSSIFKEDPSLVIINARLGFHRTGPECTADNLASFNRTAALRRQRGIGLEPSLGSFFLNPEGTTAGLLLDRAGLKGYQEGGAAVSTEHANVIVNKTREATAKEICSVSRHCQKVILDKYGIKLIPEVVLYGFD